MPADEMTNTAVPAESRLHRQFDVGIGSLEFTDGYPTSRHRGETP